MAKKKETRKGFSFTKEDFSKKNIIEGGVVRPVILLLAFSLFILAMFFVLLGVQGATWGLKWGGSLVIFSFILNMYAVYLSLCDEPSIFRTLNLIFKLVLFAAEIVALNFVIGIVRFSLY